MLKKLYLSEWEKNTLTFILVAIFLYDAFDMVSQIENNIDTFTITRVCTRLLVVISVALTYIGVKNKQLKSFLGFLSLILVANIVVIYVFMAVIIDICLGIKTLGIPINQISDSKMFGIIICGAFILVIEAALSYVIWMAPSPRIQKLKNLE